MSEEQIEKPKRRPPGRKKKEEVESPDTLVQEAIETPQELVSEEVKQDTPPVIEQAPIVESPVSEIIKKDVDEDLKKAVLAFEQSQKFKESQPQLSVQAEKWRRYLPMQGLTPERFLQKYPNHPSKKFVEEIVAFLSYSEKKDS